MSMALCTAFLLSIFFLIPACIGVGMLCRHAAKNCVRNQTIHKYSAYSGMVATAITLITVTAMNVEVKPCGKDSVATFLKNTPAQTMVAVAGCDCEK